MKLFKNVALVATAMLALGCAATAHAETIDGYDSFSYIVGGPACYKMAVERDSAGNVTHRILRETYHRCADRSVAAPSVYDVQSYPSVRSQLALNNHTSRAGCGRDGYGYEIDADNKLHRYVTVRCRSTDDPASR